MTDAGFDELAAALADRYLVEEEVGRGASATVYRARDLRHERWVALKVLHSALGAALGAERFQREIRTQARLQHPHLLPLFDSGVAAGRLYYTMPYVATGSLRERLGGTAPLSVAEVVQVVGEVASALGYAHALGVIHRDLKPENILLTMTGHALVSDFGIAYSLEEESRDTGGAVRLTETGLTLGTPAYMSPEQSAGDEPVDGRSDIYSLAAVVYEALAGVPPITGPNARTIIARRLTESPPPASSLRPGIPPAIDRALTRALSRRPEDRFESAADFARALEGEEEPPVAGTPSPGGVPRSTWRRPALGAGVAALAVLALLGIRQGRRPADPSASSGPKVLVVLPLKNLGPAEDQYFADGLTEELTSRLAGLTGLRVISRTSADQYRSSGKSLKTIGAELGAGYVLEGSVRWERAGAGGGPGRIRVTPQLIQVRDDSHLWSQMYEEELGAAFAVQSAIAEQVTAALDVALRAPERAALAAGGTRRPEAYDFYLRGLDYLNRSNQAGDLLAAADLFTEAVKADSAFAQGQARLARAHLQVFWHYYDHTDARLGLARRALAAAEALAPDLAETHIAKGYFYYWGELDYEGALREFEAALRQQPSNAELLQAIGYVERRQGRWEESTAHFVEGLRYDPRSGVRNFEVGDNYQMMRMYPEAEHYLDRAIVLSPDWPNPYVYKASMYVTWRGDLARARAILGQSLHRLDVNRFAASMSAGDRISASLITADSTFAPMIDGLALASFTGDSPRYHTLKAEAARFRGDRASQIAHGDSARAIVEPRLQGGPHEPRMLAVLALAYAQMERPGEAIPAAERAVELMPFTRDAVSGPFFHTNLALVYMYAGQTDRAVDVLEPLLKIPCWISPAELRTDPIWEPLRSSPRFRRLMEG